MMNKCEIRGCRRLETHCADCGRSVIDRIMPSVGEWISTNEPPIKEGMYLVTDGKIVRQGAYCGSGFWNTSSYMDCPEYWMPLPKPPEPSHE